MADGILRHGRLGMGTWCLGDRPETRSEEIAALRYGLERGITIIDTAELYGGGRSERLVGEAVKPFAREEIYLVSKVLPANYLDMYLYHWRGSTPLQETVDALEAAAAKGKIKSWGVSNFDLEDM